MVALILASLPVSLADLNCFPAGAGIYCQIDRHRGHLERLRYLRGVHGWSNGQWDAAIVGTERDLRYWELLERARFETAGIGDVWRLRQLAELRDLIGPERYYAGWQPALFPDCPIVPCLTEGLSD